MTPVDLHPEELFDSLRVGTLSAVDRARLEAHCTRCSACQFELQWLETNASAAQPTAEDFANGEAAFDRVLRATRRVPDVRDTRLPKHWPLRWGVGGLILGTSLSLALFFGREMWSGSAAPIERHERAASPTDPAERPPPSRDPPVMETIPTPSALSQPIAASPPSANALLAAARRAQTQDNASRARHLYRSVIHAYPASAEADAARVALGRLDYELADARSALPLLEDYLHRHPSGALAEEALYYRALSLERLGRRREAHTGLRALLQAFPSSVYAAQARTRLSDGRGE
jgi:tetratricopeptide (TPR) repeat protein